MCRIFGLVDPASPAAACAEVGRRMLAALHHGGPDDHHLVTGPGIVLGATRLAINDPARGDQPYRTATTSVFFNGEIYNSPELRADHPAATWRSHCDGEVLPWVIDRDGLGARSRLDGMFAVAAWSVRDRTLTLLRDPAGIKPLYYFADGGRVGFASEIPALVALRGRPAQVRAEAIPTYLRFRAVYGTETAAGWPTAVDGIWSLPPGAALTVGPRGEVTVHPAPPDPAPPADDLALVLDTAVEATTRGDSPFCCVLSGGLDSSVVTALAASRVDGPLRTYTIVPDRPSAFDESGYAREVARRHGTDHREVVVSPRMLPARLPRVVERLGQPNADPITVSTDVLFEAIAADGFKVALTGDGSDEVFGGYARFSRALAGAGLGAYVDDIGSMPAALRREVLCPELADPPTVLDEPGFAARYAADPLRTVMDFEVAHRLPVYHLQRVDHLSATHAVEARVPFCQPAVRAFARGLPELSRIGADGRVKKALTETAARNGWVPESVVRRPKQPFTFSLAENLFAEPATSRWVHDVLLDPGAGLRDVVRPGAAERLLGAAAARSGAGGARAGGAGSAVGVRSAPGVREERAAQAVWSLLVLELWLAAVRGW